MKSASVRLVVMFASAAALAAACTSQPTILPSRDLDRPSDLTFVCLGAFTPVATPAPGTDDGGVDGEAPEAAAPAGTELVVSGRPMRECHPRQSSDPAPSVASRTFAFLPQSSSGQLAVVDADKWKLVDLDPINAGFNQAPLGVLPSQITASDDGCRLVTANHGSCDLSLVDPSALLARTLSNEFPQVPESTGNAPISTVVPKVKGVPLGVLPGEVAFVPHPTAGMTGGQNLCPANWSWRALVTFPSCDLIALVDVPSGEIIDGAYVRRKMTAGGTMKFLQPEPLNGQAPVCPVRDCTSTGVATPVDAGGAETGAAATTDADVSEAGAGGGADDAGPAVVPAEGTAIRPGAIAIIPESGRGFVGLANGDVIVSVDVTNDHLGNWGTIQLADGAIGTSRLRLSIDPYGDKTKDGPLIPGRFVGNDRVQDRQYLYAVARDGSVRVVQVAQSPERECETNIDPMNLPPNVTLQDSCIPVQQPPYTYRRPTALGPGIRLPSPAIDVAVADIRPTAVDQSESTVQGTHAWVLTASGNIFLVNLDPVTRRTVFVEANGDVLACTTAAELCFQEPDPPPNSLRNRNVMSYSQSLDPSSGPPRIDVPPTPPLVGPHIESIWTRGTENNATAQSGLYKETPVFFPDPSTVTSQTWTVTWEGALMTAPRMQGQILVNQIPARLYDPGNDFCRLGMKPGDLMTITGCVDDRQCGIGQECVHGNEGMQGAGGVPIGGLCLKEDTDPAVCGSLLGTVRRYDVTKARPNVLVLAPHKDELFRPNLRPCKPGTAGGDGGTDGGDPNDAGDAGVAGDGGDAGASDAGGDGASRPSLPGDTCPDPSDPTTSSFQCINSRCLQRCETVGAATGCRAGRICVAFDRTSGAPLVPQAGAGCANNDCYCADGPDLNSVNAGVCASELLAYQANVGRGFLVVGGATGIPRTEIAVPDPDAPGQAICIPDPSLDPRVAMRIPMDAPRCKNVPDNVLDSRCNPDSLGTCFTQQQIAMLGAQAAPVAAEGIAKGLLDIDKNTKGDPNPCLFEGGPNKTDPAGTAAPHVHGLFRNNEIQFMLTNLEESPSGVFQIRFDVHGGFRPQTVIFPSSIEATMPTRLLLGPVDALPQSNEYAGEVPYLFVVDQRRLGRTQGGGPTRGQLLRIHPLGFKVPTPVGYQPWYEDFAHSGMSFPIQ